MNDSERQQHLIDHRKAAYPAGARIELISMGPDPDAVEPGTKGTVELVDGMGTIHPRWDNGRTLGVTLEDRVRRID